MRTGVKWVMYHHSDALFTQFENAFLYEFSNYVCNYLFKVKEKKKETEKFPLMLERSVKEIF